MSEFDFLGLTKNSFGHGQLKALVGATRFGRYPLCYHHGLLVSHGKEISIKTTSNNLYDPNDEYLPSMDRKKSYNKKELPSNTVLTTI